MAKESSNGRGIDELIDQAGAEYRAARTEAGEVTAARVNAAAELERLKEEAAGLRARLAEFEGGDGAPMTAAEFIDASYRVQWLAGAIKAQGKIVANTQEAERAANYKLTGIHSRARNEIEALLKSDFEAAATAARLRLEDAFGIDRPQSNPARRGFIQRIPVPDQF